MEKKLNVTSTVLEKGLDIAKDFIDKLIMPAVEESGLLVKDQITLWRFKRQITMVNKAQDYCKKHNISPKQISLKLLSPLLEYSSLEEDDVLLDKWAVLLGNLVDSDQNIENHVFPYILSQISKNEFVIIESVTKAKRDRIKKLNDDLDEWGIFKDARSLEISAEISALGEQYKASQKKDYQGSNPPYKIKQSQVLLEEELQQLFEQGKTILRAIDQPEALKDLSLKEFELFNLIRLGLVQETHEPFVEPRKLRIPNYKAWENIDVELKIDIKTTKVIILTELGEFFIKACSEKSQSDK